MSTVSPEPRHQRRQEDEVNRACWGHLPNRSMIAAQREPAPRCLRSPEPPMERLMRWVAWGLLLLGTTAGLCKHWSI
jgi:hypothetical protein